MAAAAASTMAGWKFPGLLGERFLFKAPFSTRESGRISADFAPLSSWAARICG